MLELKNHTALTAEIIPGLDQNGYDYVALVIKGNFTLNPSNPNLTLSEQPSEIVKADKYYDEADNSSVQYESDVCILKKGTDIVLNGHAYAPHNQMSQMVDVGLQINDKSIVYRVFGDRQWIKNGLSWGATAPKSFDRLALTYENAFGGVDVSTLEDEIVQYSEFNPIGKGFVGNKKSPVEGLYLPNIENPQTLISQYKDRPMPSGFGFISRSWHPRVQLAGTYDENWQTNRMPLLPLDFNEQYYNAAHPSLITPSHLLGGERILLRNLSSLGDIGFIVPEWNTPVKVTVKGRSKNIKPLLDTVVIEPDINNVSLTWRVTMPCYKQFLYINSISIGRKSAV